MGGLISLSTIWNFVGFVSAIAGLVCFGLSSTYKISFGKFGFGGLLVYLLVGLMVWCLILWGKRIRVSEKVQGPVAALMFDVICLISVVNDKLVLAKSDAWSIISYGSFALMSLSMSRKFELGFETGFSSFFLTLFATQLFKINWILFLIALLFSSLVVMLRHYPESGVEFGSINLNHMGSPNAAVLEIGDEDIYEEMQDSSGKGEVSGHSLLSMNYQKNNQKESSQATHHSASNGDFSEGSMLDWDKEQNNEKETRSSFAATHHFPRIGEASDDWNNEQNDEEEEDRSSFPAESSYQDHVSSGVNTVTIQNGWMHSSSEPELISAAAPWELLRDRAGHDAIQLNTWRLQVSDGRHFTYPRLMYDPSRRVWLWLEEAALVFRMVEEADLELTMRPEMRVSVKPEAADSGDDSGTSSPTSVLQVRTDADEEGKKGEGVEEEEEEPFEECQSVTTM
ncbi:uncharacterized protein LOC114727917 [Neltuma alba]|uniref:uncharacterized protein LOC114727917 n=1 Tax=Neltuma alba TaxID=207710 RepID=UPI0010A54BE7|nr:uncharacterized protein LOC114727917 [Prosopis alba]XP_028770537.1 uncharacterized protein LOC114727917 [Prosopis alba]